MPITSKPNYLPTLFAEDVQVGAQETFDKSVESAFLDNPSKRIYDSLNYYYTEKKAKEENAPRLTQQEAMERAGSKGLQIDNIPDTISEDAYNLLEARQYNRQRLATTLSRSDHDLIGLAGGFAGGLADPINIAASFAPVPGLGVLQGQLLKAGTNIFQRSLVRAQIGAIEGAVGTAALSVAITPVARQLGDEHGISEITQETLAGTALGVFTHTVAGGIGDHIKFKKMSPTDKADYMNASMAQFMDDRSVNHSFIDKIQHNKLVKRADKLEQSYAQALLEGDTEQLDYLDTQKELVNNQLGDIATEAFKKQRERFKKVTGKEYSPYMDAKFVEYTPDEISQGMKEANGGAGDRYASAEEVHAASIEAQDPVFNDLEKNMETIIDEEALTLNEKAKQMEKDMTEFFDDMNAKAKDVDDFSDHIRAFADCMTRGR
jgi:hypothetical protein